MIKGGYQNRRLDAIQEAQLFPFKMGEDVVEGYLVWLNPTDLKLYLADPTNDRPATHILAEGQMEKIGLAHTDNRVSKAYAGSMVNPVLTYLFNADSAFTNAQVAGKAPVYLDTDGHFTLTAPVVVGDIIQIVGHVVSQYHILIDLTYTTSEDIT